MIKAIFFDIDGTLISFNTHKISSHTLDALHQVKQDGIKLFIATGRHKLEVDRFEGFEFEGHVTMNGQYCYNDKEIIYKKPIDKNTVQSVIKLAEDTGEAYMFFEENNVYLNKINHKVEKVLEEVKVNNIQIEELSQFSDKEIFQIVCFVTEKEEKEVKSKLPLCEITRWHPLFMDINPKGGNKKNGILKMLDYYHISPDEIMAIGDGENDISMLEVAKYSVAMENASEQVKSHAGFITSHVDDDGVVNALKHYGLI
ncbi:Cof-type HAD-IIB family hydrolase [Apibacter raozihei]|uniref:Cof-type HAD-IIB family hydrolase n=1 Tax=Apibacter raozihei TaxID=2500547 RepID=UPI000FE2F1AC|nr:Cof-type HAD-IIB family hydrolase [Apibacter raozihei]